jgi:DNA-directed RNA polymerase sigma subunit (sigma70/sigma32)
MEIYVADNSKKLHEQALALQRIAYEMRREEMMRMRKEGKTLREIGRKFNLTRERVRQILLEK